MSFGFVLGAVYGLVLGAFMGLFSGMLQGLFLGLLSGIFLGIFLEFSGGFVECIRESILELAFIMIGLDTHNHRP